ncbi:nineteen complex-related protein 2-domain-containing protein [Pestalotiopsis sp. NC0098]|nr:nineteen complex-related protein 2-domain-containing protein [Pestalotiopsis sp. NC0098]
MSAFGGKRKARKITIHNEDEDEGGTDSPTPPSAVSDFEQGPALQPTFKTRPLKQSQLRKTIKISDIDEPQPNNSTEDDEDGGAPVVVRPALAGRAGSSKIKKRAPASKLSFDDDKQSTGDDDGAFLLGGDKPVSEAKPSSLAAAATTKLAHRKGLTKNNRIPTRSEDEDEDRPRYSKEYLSELQSATPNTPANLESLQIADEDVEMSLDPSELEGATLVQQTTASAGQPTVILTEAEIQEKKERRARKAQQAGADDFISFSDDDRGAGESYLSVLAKRQPTSAAVSQKKEKRLTKDDNLDEDDSFFVEDGGLSLGARAEREARKKKRADMASMIATAEGVDNDDGETSDDSEAERRAAYESAQTRAGMDGLAEEREQQRRRLARDAGAQVPPKVTPLPDLSVKVQEYKQKMAQKLVEIQRARTEIDRIQQERAEIDRREPELQQLLNEAGERYRSLMGGNVPPTQTVDANGTVAAAKSLLDHSKNVDTPGRGLESMGTTPLRQAEQMD